MLSTLSKVTMYIVFIYLFIIQKNISLLGRLCFLYLIPVVVVGAKQNAHVLWPQRGHLCQKGPVTMLCCPGLSYEFIGGWLGIQACPTSAISWDNFNLNTRKLFSLWSWFLKNIFLVFCVAMHWTYGNRGPARMKLIIESRASRLFKERVGRWGREKERI